MKMYEHEIVEKGTLQDCIDYNDEYDNSTTMCYSEATKFDLDAMKTFLSIRDRLTHTDDCDAKGEWRTLRTAQNPKKYGMNYIFIDVKGKQWRTRQTASEFYGYRPPEFDISELSA